MIEKMSLLTIAGMTDKLDEVLFKCCGSGCFHIESAANKSFDVLKESNPYTSSLKKIYNISENMNIELNYNSNNAINTQLVGNFNEYLQKVITKSDELNEIIRIVTNSIEEHKQSLKRVEHLHGLNVGFREIFACKYVKVRFGRLPADSYPKLSYYNDKTFFFIPFDENGGYHWGVYFAPSVEIELIDDIFNSLYFERLRVPDYITGTADEAVDYLNGQIKEAEEKLSELQQEKVRFKAEEEEMIKAVYSRIKFLDYVFEVRKNVSVMNNKFYLVGFTPTKESDRLIKLLDEIDGVSAIENPYDLDQRLAPPILLKNNRFIKPFEMFVKMYGLPKYNEIDPTPFVALTYCMLFGIMFGDLGQGLLISVLGFILCKKKKISLGRIMTRIGLSSAFFGTLYGSVFGYEHLLDGFYKSIGFHEKPIEVFEMSQILLLVALAIGAVIIMISMILNIILSLKRRQLDNALFGPNGIAGLTLYASVLLGLAATVMLNIKVFTPLYVVFLVLLPIVVIFFRHPLNNMITNSKEQHEKQSVSNFIIENIIELFECSLSYVTNTMSFLRVGGFVLSHAGMMLVIFALAESVPSPAYPVVMVLGNLFVVGMEGLLVGIQVLRLEFYEIFSRFYKTTDKEFSPLGKIN